MTHRSRDSNSGNAAQSSVSPRQASVRAGKRQRIAVAVLQRGDRFLIARRRANRPFAGFWELPGGKCLPGEDIEACLIREVREETGVSVVTAQRAATIEHVYPDWVAEFHVFFCSVVQGEPKARQSEEIAWIRWDEIRQYRFPPANDELFAQVAPVRSPRAEGPSP